MSSDAAGATDDRVRPWLAALLAFLLPGAGHLYLRAWVRALLWFGLFYTTFFLVVPPEAQAVEPTLDGIVAGLAAIPAAAQAAFMSITVLSMADAYWLAVRQNDRAEVDTGATCPNCGKELDDDIDFCHWCTTRLDDPTHEDERPA